MGRSWMLRSDLPVGGTDKVLYCHWQNAMSHYRLLREKSEPLLDRFTEHSVLRYMLTCEEQLRGAAIDKTRNDQFPWGEAIHWADKDQNQVWSDNREMLQPMAGRGGQRAGQSNPPGPSKQNQTPAAAPGTPAAATSIGGGGTSPHAGGASMQSTCKETAQGVLLCKAFNDKRGCQSTCPRGQVHACDIRLEASGQACASKKHNRRDHDAARHGKPAARS